ncbi:hypothetical protein TVAG_028080 [Trichomonas vaginalis G3]|uniref:Right handed beta helix domain-containing protein n=1 Tax=Trichomonas vaginalis (strain ATCC PRA-98 / G3) TaxID=412133 RepID=A2E547_TRIV3|nr:hypothetical protein TVAGG3_0419340 [Trichomonas vaginalis G3]EAY12255.1 hypothetical protein TVAG_028080 [Trichomonas vaginalis G3]KAI5535930.1 hypothetical protein TVAGG3_0419340 [Trichomonas vaginalis G3]|eukprot:XP_001324478.1 hypothetical protein [Trichomonas vaginalis G3]
MISLFLQSVYCRKVTGRYTESKLWDTLEENLLIVDCVFSNLGGTTAYSPVWIDGGLGNKIEVLKTMFLECSAQTNGPFAFEGEFYLKMDKVLDARNYAGSGNNGVMGRISTSGEYNITMSSFIDNTGGARNIRLENTPRFFENLNVSGNYASSLGHGYAYGNFLLDHAKTSPVVTWCNFEECRSSCGILYIASNTGQTVVQHCNFVKNQVDGYGAIGVQHSKPVTIKDTIFYGNRYKKSPVVYALNTVAQVSGCYLDVNDFEGVSSIENNMVTSKKPYEMTLFATERVKAAVPYTPETSTNNNGNNNGNSGNNNGNTGNNNGNHQSSGEGEANASTQSDGTPANQTEGFFMKKAGSLRVWMIFVIVGCVLIVFIICVVIYRKKHHHHHHHHHHHKGDGDDEDEEEENAEAEEAPQP